MHKFSYKKSDIGSLYRLDFIPFFIAILAAKLIRTAGALQGLIGTLPEPFRVHHDAQLPHKEYSKCQKEQGSGIKAVEDDCLRLLSYGSEIADRYKTKAFFKLCSGQPKAKDGEIPVLVFNLNDPENIKRAVLGENIGTIVK